jgi:hypothetical protein
MSRLFNRVAPPEIGKVKTSSKLKGILLPFLKIYLHI